MKLFQNLSIGLAEVLCVCVYSNSRNDVLRVAQQYGTIAAHTRRHASVLVVFVVFCVHMLSFACLIRRTPPPTLSELQSQTATLIPLFSSSELTGLLDRKNRSDMCPRWESNPRLPACKASTLSTRPGSPLSRSSFKGQAPVPRETHICSIIGLLVSNYYLLASSVCTTS